MIAATREGWAHTMTDDPEAHWNSVYGTKSDDQLSWHQEDPSVSLELIDWAGLALGASVIDIGGGTSRLAARLIERGHKDVTVLDISRIAIEKARGQIGPSADNVTWIAANVTTWIPLRSYDLWHDRAVFHFMTAPEDRTAYLACMTQALAPGGHTVLATFALDGPERCSGLPVVRYSPETLSETLGADYALIASRARIHETPAGKPQAFQFSLFQKVA